MEKLKRIFCTIILAIIILLIYQTGVFAKTTTKNVTNSNNVANSVTNTTNSTNTTNATNSSNSTTKNTSNTSNTNSSKSNNTSNTTNEISEDELIPALEEKLKEQEEDEEEDDETEESTVSAEESVKSAISKSQREEIEEDIYLLQIEEDLAYENVYVDGNIYIISSQKVLFNNCDISGNIYILSNSFEMSGTNVEGNIYIISKDVVLSNSFMLYGYIATENIEIDEDVEIENDLKCIATSALINCTIGRDLVTKTEYIELGSKTDIERNINIATVYYEMPSKIEKSSNLNLEILEIETEEVTTLDLIKNLLPELFVEFLIILVIAIIILGGSPKFTEVNRKLKLSNFFKTFFTGILEILIINILAILLIATGYGLGYGLALMVLCLILIYFGKAIFIVSFAIRLVRSKNKHVKIKSFIITIMVALVVEIINIISVLGSVGFIINLIFDLILGISGFGTFVKVILSSIKKKNISENSNCDVKKLSNTNKETNSINNDANNTNKETNSINNDANNINKEENNSNNNSTNLEKTSEVEGTITKKEEEIKLPETDKNELKGNKKNDA